MKKYLATDGGADNPRYEIKMVAQSMVHADVVASLRTDVEGVRSLFPPRQVQSLYMDTPGNRALEDNLAGISHREKLRLRWYGKEDRNVPARLENKVRHDNLGWKQVHKFSSFDVGGVNRHALMKRIRTELPMTWLPLISGPLEPVQWICYEREYLATADQVIRVTLDRKLRAWDQRGRFVVSNRFGTQLPRLLIVEVKCAAKHYDRAKALISRLPLFVGKCSKFVMASSPGEGPMLMPHY